LSIRSHWPRHVQQADGALTTGEEVGRPADARRCTVQLSTGRLYLDAVASPATALFGHDRPPTPPTDEQTVKRMLSSLAPRYRCLALTRSFAAAADFAVRLGESDSPGDRRIAQINALEGEPAPGDLLVVHENETLGRTGQWLASSAWSRAPDLVVIGEALALGVPFGAVLAESHFVSRLDLAGLESVSRSRAAAPHPRGHVESTAFSDDHNRVWPECLEAATPRALECVAAAITAVETEGLLSQGRELATYLRERLLAVRTSCRQIESVAGTGLSLRIAFTPPLRAAEIRRKMCERGVLTGVDERARLAIDPPLAMRIAEIDVITGALRASIVGLPPVSSSACCAACREDN